MTKEQLTVVVHSCRQSHARTAYEAVRRRRCRCRAGRPAGSQGRPRGGLRRARSTCGAAGTTEDRDLADGPSLPTSQRSGSVPSTVAVIPSAATSGCSHTAQPLLLYN